MSASQKIVKIKNLCVYSEIGKSGRVVTVSMIDPLITSVNKWVNFNQFVRNYEIPSKNLKSPELVNGSMLPALFKADGFDFEVQFKVTLLKISTKQSRFAVTDIHLNGLTTDRAVPVDSSIVYPQMLLRLAIRASAVTGIAYPSGWLIDAITGEYISTLKVGDEQPLNSICHGVETKSGKGIKRISSRDPKRSGVEYTPRFVTKLTEPDVLVHQIGREIDHAELNDLIGKVQKPRDNSKQSGTNPKIQQLVAKLYALPVPDQYKSQVEYVRSQLIQNHGIHNGESWVRQTASRARKSGLFQKPTKRKQAK